MHRRLQIANEVASKASLTSPGCFLETGRDFKHFNIFWSKFGWMNISRTSCFFSHKNRLLAFFVEPICCHPKSRRSKTSQLMGWISEDHVLSYLEEEGLKDRTPMVSWPVFFSVGEWGLGRDRKGGPGSVTMLTWVTWGVEPFSWTVFSIHVLHVLLVSISPPGKDASDQDNHNFYKRIFDF